MAGQRRGRFLEPGNHRFRGFARCQRELDRPPIQAALQDHCLRAFAGLRVAFERVSQPLDRIPTQLFVNRLGHYFALIVELRKTSDNVGHRRTHAEVFDVDVQIRC